MADEPGSLACAACGRELPARQGAGRRRRYCNATCRSAARRQRERAARTAIGFVNKNLTVVGGHDNFDIVLGDPGPGDPVAIRVRDAARHLLATLGRPAAGSPLGAVAAARELSAASHAAQQAAVDRARAGGYSWREIGDVLQTTRQAAFQRFGRPADPRTGQPTNRATLPGAEDRAAALIGLLSQGRWAAARQQFSAALLERLDAGRLADAWAQVAGTVGRLERTGDPLAFAAGEHTVVDVPLSFEAGERTGRVSFGPDGKITGLFIRPAAS
jgi:Protein of unknown function (DUF3887)